MWKNFKDTRRIECLNFTSVLGYHKTGSSIFTLDVAGNSEGKESFIHRLIRLMCGTCDDLDKSPQSIVNNSRIVHSTELIYTSVTHLMLLH